MYLPLTLNDKKTNGGAIDKTIVDLVCRSLSLLENGVGHIITAFIESASTTATRSLSISEISLCVCDLV